MIGGGDDGGGGDDEWGAQPIIYACACYCLRTCHKNAD
jgi:hypothetical protein